ncbi:MAG: leucyl aminopeptidase family protein [Gammaproteobacteria bacterium]|nr:leucyl aminopeptidase family protein [Gammaproteobacteria bacterium]MDE2346494.1 leucyl aminopeptidase family protein [Gammaproteobacteria bacterium]
MQIPPAPKFELKQVSAAATPENVDALDALIILLPESALQKHWPLFPYSERFKKHYTAGMDTPEPRRVDLPNARATTAVIAFVKSGASVFDLLTLARKTLAKALENDPREIGLLIPGIADAQQQPVAEAVVACMTAAAFKPPLFKSIAHDKQTPISLSLLGIANKIDFSYTLAAAEGNALARWLTLLPANLLTPGEYRACISGLARREGWKFRFLDERRLAKLGAGAFLAVARGSDSRDAGIAHLSYSPAKPAGPAKTVALVGKGICYDTGGVNLKSAKSMYGMHGDMQGSAVALGTLLALTRLKAPFRVECWLAVARNQIGPRAYTQNEVITACNGVRIEIVHTDAEGRMVLADALSLASRDKPALLLDYATLTGTCVTALGTRYSGAFCNRQELITPVLEAGRRSGERVWPLPVDADYDESIESSIADVKQCAIENDADHILAARFLSRFVPASVPWIHMDLAASEHKGGLAHIPTEVTGFGVRFSLELLLKQGLPRL